MSRNKDMIDPTSARRREPRARRAALMCAGALAVLGGSRAFGQFWDEFNRPDGQLQAPWTSQGGFPWGFRILDQRLVCDYPLPETVEMTFGGAEGPYDVDQSIDVFSSGSARQFVALISGHRQNDRTQRLYIKVQNSGGAQGFDTMGFYSGINSPIGWPGAGPTFIVLDQPFTQARMRVRFLISGDVITVEFDTNFDGTPDQSYGRHGVRAFSASFGRGYGIGAFGPAVMDNWRIGPPCTADCDWTTGINVLDIFDFLCFQDFFARGAAYACDCDTSTGPGVCDILDFLCFQNAFAAGCP